ncbi:16S rRNA (cytidine(1402)-2'-O)-methyltransferase [Sinimarinibacterium sp. CAU 1509]|uniref:16S rRNA (cytidine(1402)-2'-O)-methyltransferase n=1 Tax=Sinimarinibacterium sp. CAU 1509 TaxID=2562283 RepID=UPI0010AC020F|nr:16S rRNA (cytidine(1402)-2'-O)-methyltransferase [Sinimarinibacterium sp. CAU 1509]TJY63037.1 16S rRNA (cytidine(1402)-2'-O)-methyltransferase [Sinimarinibacterium sp. CAU 1509]
MPTLFDAVSHERANVAAGHLYVVATPIGNLGDLSPRAQAVLSSVDRICAEDTRTTGHLLSHFGIRKPLTALHEHNESAASQALIEQLQGGATLALVSDAGTPLISDPGFVLVRAARAADVPVIAIPGPCAAITALSLSGLPSDRFLFEGFLPAKRGARRERLQTLAALPQTFIVYESSHRIADTAQDLAELLPGRSVCLARELTKLHEQSVVMDAAALPTWLAADTNRSRGEFVLVIGGQPGEPAGNAAETERVLRILLQEMPASSAARVAAQITGERKKVLYDLALTLSQATAGHGTPPT